MWVFKQFLLENSCWTILVQLISAKGWTSRRRESSFPQARQKAPLCAFYFSVRNWCPCLISVWVCLFPSHSSLVKPPLCFCISCFQQPIFLVMQRLNAQQLSNHIQVSPCLCRRVSQPHISGPRLLGKEHSACQTDILSQNSLPKHFGQALVFAIALAYRITT